MNVIAVDVGSTGVRVAIVSFEGSEHQRARILANHETDIKYYQENERFEQSSDEIWRAVCECAKACMLAANDVPIDGIGFSATCSLVIQETTRRSPRNVIMWMDHRAIEEAKFITESNSRVLDQLGGVCSPEFSLAKILWLKHHAPERLFDSETNLFELPDWLVWRSISVQPEHSPRSLCCLTCKWGYDAKHNRNCDIIESIGRESLTAGEVFKPGTIAGYLSQQAALELGIRQRRISENGSNDIGSRHGIVVGASLIDAHSGMLAMLSARPRELAIEDTFCSLAGTSSCHMLLSQERRFCHGIWGPYENAVLENYYLLESGQTLTGKLIEICIERTQEGRRLMASGKSMKQIIQNLNKEIELASYPESELHILPTFHGNRSPLANPRLCGGIYGLTAHGEGSLLQHYISSVEAIAFEVKLIVDTLKVGHLGNILVSGGLMKNRFYMKTLADVLGCRAIRMSLKNVDFMVMGGALVARCAVLNSINDEHITNLPLQEDNIKGIQYEQLDMETFEPEPANTARGEYLSKKYACYKKFVDFSISVDEIMRQ